MKKLIIAILLPLIFASCEEAPVEPLVQDFTFEHFETDSLEMEVRPL